MIRKSTSALLAAACSTALIASTAEAAIVIENKADFNSYTDLFAGGNNNKVQFNFDTTGADKLVVFLTGEHGFNNTSGNVDALTYGGVSLTQVSERNPVTNNSDILYADVWILDNPTGGSQLLDATVQTRGNVTAFALSGTAAGIIQDSIGALGSRSTTMNTTAGNLVLAALNVGGNGNTGVTSGITADAPLTLESANSENTNWNGHATASAIVATTGSNTYSFTGGDVAGGFITAIEIGVVPEPSSLALLGLGGLLIARRRRS